MTDDESSFSFSFYKNTVTVTALHVRGTYGGLYLNDCNCDDRAPEAERDVFFLIWSFLISKSASGHNHNLQVVQERGKR